MVDRVATKRMGNFDMASAADRVLAFWEKFPNGKIETVKKRDEEEGNLLVFVTYIWKNKADYIELAKIPGITDRAILSSSDVNGTAKQAEGKEAKKDFEKLETISVGRALALLGFLKDGQIASSEEMEEFNSWKTDKVAEETATAIEYLQESETLEDLQKRWTEIGGEVKKVKEVIEAKDLLKGQFIIDAKKKEAKAKKESK